MSPSRDEILLAALALSEEDRFHIADGLFESLPDEPPGLSIDDPDFIAELDRRAADKDGWVPYSELWKRDSS